MARLEIFSLVYSFSSLPISDQTVTPHRFQITLPAITKDLAWVLLKESDIFIFPTLSLSLIRGRYNYHTGLSAYSKHINLTHMYKPCGDAKMETKTSRMDLCQAIK